MKAVAYYRTSSATNVGWDKDSEARQREVVAKYAAAHDIEVVEEFYDAAVSGSDPVDQRQGFISMLDYTKEENVSLVLIETVNRFARDLVVQLTGHKLLQEKGIEILPVDSPQHFKEDTPTAHMVRQILGAVAEFDKASLVARLKQARDRKREKYGRCEGRPPVPKEVVDIAIDMRKEGATLRHISDTLAKKGYKGPRGRPYFPRSISHMIQGAKQDRHIA